MPYASMAHIMYTYTYAKVGTLTNTLEIIKSIIKKAKAKESNLLDPFHLTISENSPLF